MLVPFKGFQRLLNSNSGEIQSTHRIKFECLNIKRITHVDNFFNPIDFLQSDVLFWNKALLTIWKLNQHTSTHDSSHHSNKLLAHFNVANRFSYHLHRLS
jgi:hypothetical protein